MAGTHAQVNDLCPDPILARDSALIDYRYADKLLRSLPRDYQENLHQISRAIRQVEQEMSAHARM